MAPKRKSNNKTAPKAVFVDRGSEYKVYGNKVKVNETKWIKLRKSK